MAARLLKATPAWRRRLVWGFVLAALLGAATVGFEQGGEGVRLAIILAVVGLVLPIVVETRFRVEELANRMRSELAAEAVVATEQAQRLATAQDEFKAALKQFGAFAQSPMSARAFFADVAADWQRLEEHGSVFLGWLRRDHEQEFRTRLRHLANGRAVLDRHSQHSFRAIPMEGFKQIVSLSATNLPYWKSPRGRRYLDNQRNAIQSHGLTVQRTIVLSADELDLAAEIIRDQMAAGVQLSLVMREEVIDRGDQDDLLHDLTIVTDNAGVVGVMRPGSPAIGESFTTDEGEIVEANRALTTLSPYQREVVEIFPGLFEA